MGDKQKVLILKGGIVISMDEERHVYDPGYVVVDGDRVIDVGPLANESMSWSDASVRDMQDHILMPGLVNCHGHHSLSLMRGFLDELPLANWYSLVLGPFISQMREEYAYASARLAIVELLLGGTTTATSSDWGYPVARLMDGVLRAIDESGMRSIVSRMTQDLRYRSFPPLPSNIQEDVREALREMERLRARWVSPRLDVVPEPSGVTRCTDRAIREIVSYVRSEDCRMFMHVASAQAETEGCREQYETGCVERLHSLDALSSRLLIAHSIWISDAEIELLAESNTAVTHNPVSNLYYATGIAPLPELLEAGVRVGLGTDTVACNNSQDMWETMKFAMLVQKQRLNDTTFGSAELALELGTIRGAEALGMQDVIGSLEVGKKADLIGVRRSGPGMQPNWRLASNLVYGRSTERVSLVMVDGEILVDQGELVRWDAEEISAEAQSSALRLIEEAGISGLGHMQSGWTWSHPSTPEAS